MLTDHNNNTRVGCVCLHEQFPLGQIPTRLLELPRCSGRLARLQRWYSRVRAQISRIDGVLLWEQETMHRICVV